MRIMQYIITSALLGPAVSAAITITTPETCNAPDTTALRQCLIQATTNSYVESFTIQLQAGTYSTQDDEQGTFIYTTPNKTNLIIQGVNTQDGWWDVPREVPKWKTETILSGADTDRIFELNATTTSGGSVIFKNLTLQNGFSSASGAAVTNATTDKLSLKLDSIAGHNNHSADRFAFNNVDSIQNSSFTSHQGTAAYVLNSVEHSYFENNSSNGTGALYMRNSGNTVDSSVFIGNTSTGDAGAVAYVETLTNSLFLNNSAPSGNGGAILTNANANAISVTNSEFSNNSATRGGAIYSYSTENVTAQSSSFTNNQAQQGGAIYNYAGHITSIQSLFSNNSATAEGGATYNNSRKAYFSESKLIDNHSATCGGAIYTGYIWSRRNEFKENHSAEGGALCINYGYVHHNQFLNNLADNEGRDIKFRNNSTQPSHLLNNSFIVDTQQDSLIASSLWVDQTSTLRFINNLMVSPTALAINITSTSTKHIFYNNIFLSPTPIYGAQGGYLRYNYIDSSKVSGLNAEHNVFNLDSLGFVDADAGDYHLTPDSALRDIGFALQAHCTSSRCDPTQYTSYTITENINDNNVVVYSQDFTSDVSLFDLDNHPRETDGLMDLGPYEYQPLPDTPQILSFSKTDGDYRIGQTVTFAAHVSSANSTLNSVQVVDEASQETLCSYQGDQLNTADIEAELSCKLTHYGNRTLLLQVSDAAGKQGSFGLNVQIADYTDYEKGVLAGVAQVQQDPASYDLVTTTDLQNQKQASQLLGEQQGIQYVLNNLNEYSLCYKDDCKINTSTTLMDLDGDKVADILWRNQQTGAVYAYYMNADKTIRSKIALSTVALTWIIAGTGDFDGDGDTDILWRNQTTGINYLYLMQGESFNGHHLNTVADQNWQVAAVADYNNDGQSDILWRNQKTGANAIHYLTKNLTVDMKLLNQIPTDWKVEPSVQ